MTPEMRYPHLSPVVAEVADMDAETRIEYVAKDRFVLHARVEEVLNDWESLMRLDDAVRPQGRLLVAHPLMGKSTLIDEFARRHMASDNPGGDAASVPVLCVQVPEQARDGIYTEILSALNARLTRLAKTSDVRQATVDLLKRVGTRILFIDEFHNILEGGAPAQRKCLNAVKYLMNATRRPVVVAGTGDVINAIQSDPQFSSRLQPTVIRRFADDDQFQLLLAGFEALLPLRKPSNLHDPDLSTLIYHHTLGILGNVADLLNEAARLAIREGTEQITEVEITALKDRRPRTPHALMDQLG
jgi:hypothetical protein